MKRLFLLSISTLLFASLGFADAVHQACNCGSGQPFSHAPIGVMGDHTHPSGEIMTSYRFMTMAMKGQRDGTRNLSSADVFARGFPVAPTEMDMNMHMIGLMWAHSDALTLMVMAQYLDIEMTHVTKPGSPPFMMRGPSFTTKSSGWGDTTLSALMKVYDEDNQIIQLNVGLGLPTGSIDETDPSPLPFPMQTGSGTYDLKPGITYLGESADWTWGAQALATVRLDENDNGYAFGDRIDTTGWLGYNLCRWASLSARLSYEWQDDIDGTNRKLPGRPAPTTDPANHGGQWVEAGVGLNLLVPDGRLKGNRLALEGLWPVYQDLNGPQLERDYTFTVGWQKAF